MEEYIYIGIRIYKTDWLFLNARRKAGETFADLVERTLNDYKHLVDLKQ